MRWNSVVKLVAFLGVGAFVVWGLFGGLGELSNLARSPRIAQVLSTPPDPANWFITTLLSASAILLLPRQFHVTVVENVDKRDIRKAATLFPLYLVLINLFVVPLAIAGLTLFPDGAIDRDLTVLALPLERGRARPRSDDDDRRPFGGDRHGGGRQRRARDHRLQRSRHADPAAPARRRRRTRRRARSARAC